MSRVRADISDAADGGETHFRYADSDEPVPNAVVNGRGGGGPPCGAAEMLEGLAVAPKKGDALLFYNMKVAAQRPDSAGVEPRAVHAGCPVRAGTKLVVRACALRLLPPSFRR